MLIKKSTVKYWLYLLFTTFILLGISEGIANLFLNNPSLIQNTIFIRPFKTYYKIYDRNAIQYVPEFGMYNNITSYTLRPGSFVFSNRAFSNHFSVNSIGVRDDEQSIVSPEIIVLGDSHAMGWGVDQDSTFANLIDNRFSEHVLNAAISSYGTYRELKFLESLDRSKLKVLIIQYCENDFNENTIFLNNIDTPIMTQAKYDSLVVNHEKTRKYFFGKHSAFLLRVLVNGIYRRIVNEDIISNSDSTEAITFLEVLNRFSFMLSKTEIVILEVSEYGSIDNKFITNIDKYCKDSRYDSFNRNITLVDLSGKISEDHRYILDGHLKAIGHKIIAKEIENIIIEKSLLLNKAM